jgi:LysM repeat protein
MGNSFIYDDEEPAQPEPTDAERMDVETEEAGGEPVPPEEGNNRTFLLAIGALGAIVLVALLCLAAYAGLFLPRQRAAQQTQQATVLAQNTDVALGATQTAASTAGSAYTVEPGDTWASIAERFGVSLVDLLMANSQAGFTLPPGLVLNLPPQTSQQGDTLAAIAARLGLLLDDLKNVNPGLPEAETLPPGQTINLPPYTVQEGDTLDAIARRFGRAVNDLLNNNPQIGGNLNPGQILVIPVVVGQAPTPVPSLTHTPVVAFATETPIVVSTVNPITATVAAAYTQAALAQLTVIPTSTALGNVPQTGFADEVGLPLLFVAGLALLVVIFLVRRLRTAH